MQKITIVKQTKFLIAAPSSGCGKTTVSLGLMRAIKRRGKVVQPFKCGPDYIDTMHHTTAAGRKSINLDTFLATKEFVQETFAYHSHTADVSVIEGVMGLFDGADKMQGSSAEIAQLLDIPIILVVNAKATAYSVAPLLYGFNNFREGIRIAGVIFNNVNTASHYEFLHDAAIDAGVKPLGYIPVNEKMEISSRHLGLSISSSTDFLSKIDAAADHMEQYLDIDALLDLCTVEVEVKESAVHPADEIKDVARMRIAVARDEAFNFAYADNLRALEAIGDVQYFSPIHDKQLPEADLVYFAGGYPEFYLQELSENIDMRIAVACYCSEGGKVLAECGGLMYLSSAVCDKRTHHYPMVGALNQIASMEQMKLHLGYRKIIYNDVEFRGHEFHYSTIRDSKEHSASTALYTAKDKKVDTPLYIKDGIRASYVHFFWAHRCQEFFTTIFDEL